MPPPPSFPSPPLPWGAYHADDASDGALPARHLPGSGNVHVQLSRWIDIALWLLYSPPAASLRVRCAAAQFTCIASRRDRKITAAVETPAFVLTVVSAVPGKLRNVMPTSSVFIFDTKTGNAVFPKPFASSGNLPLADFGGLATAHRLLWRIMEAAYGDVMEVHVSRDTVYVPYAKGVMLCMQYASNGIYEGLRFTHAMAVHSQFDPSRLAVRDYKPYFPKLWLSTGGSDFSFPPDQVWASASLTALYIDAVTDIMSAGAWPLLSALVPHCIKELAQSCVISDCS